MASKLSLVVCIAPSRAVRLQVHPGLSPALTGPTKRAQPSRPTAHLRQLQKKGVEQKDLGRTVKAWAPSMRFNLGAGSTKEINNCIDASRRGGGGLARTAQFETTLEAQQVQNEVPMSGAQQNPNLLHTLKTGDFSTYAFRCPAGKDPNNATTPGVYLPKVMRSTQALWGISANKAGTPSKLEYLSKSIPTDWAPRFLTSDCFSQSSSVYSNFRKTKHSFDDRKDPDRWITSRDKQYEHPPAGWECAHCAAPNPHVKPYGRYKRALEAAEREREWTESLATGARASSVW